MSTLKKDFASKLLEVKAIKLQPNDPFTWASGWKSPFYCDNRKTLSFPWLRSYVKLELVHTILEHFPEAEAVAGVATGAIAQGALVADELNFPYVYVRSKRIVLSNVVISTPYYFFQLAGSLRHSCSSSTSSFLM